MTLAAGTKLGPYEIHSPLGAGGMGEVYRATDTKLGRDIALKVLPAEMAHDPERLTRFRREAKALAQLDHPNIVTIHSVEECNGVHFLTMQLVEGQPLDRLITSGGLPVEQIVEIASALGDALAAAHDKGIVHRDLKPGNVMVSSEGRVKVLDFGLAKDVRPSSVGDATLTSASQTQVGVVMGTPAYMSPEQTSGRPLDHRTDIFSLGVVLHEMATGHRPFEGGSSAELVSAILRDAPPSVTDVRPDLPSDLARIIRRCLEKDPRHRVQTARDVSNEFRDLSRQTSQKIIRVTTSTTRTVATADSGSTRADEGFWVAVLPFKYSGTNSDLTALAEGLTEDIVTGLSRFSYLRVIARGSTGKYSSESGDVRAIGKALGARYVMEGSLRQAGSRLRLAVQLVDATSGAHLWAETFDRAFVAEEIFELQDNLVPRIVSTVAETHGVLPYSMSQTLRNRNPDELTPYEALLRGFAYFKHVNVADHAGARAALEKAVQEAPGNADCWAMLSMLYREENNHGYNVRPDPVGRALAAARRAVDTAPSNHLAHHALASVLFFRRETQAFRSAAQRAIELNPMDGFTIGYMGFLLSYSGDWERGCALMERARSLNPNHPGWYWFPPFFNAYRKGEYREALEFALKVNMPGFWRNELALAATYGQLGELEMARSAARELLAARPEFATAAREECRKWWSADLVEQIVEGLRKAGLEIAPEGKPATATTKSELAFTPDSGASRADEGFWVAVLPVKYSGANTELAALAEGLTEEVITGLSRFSYLRVIARGSTAKYSSEAGDVRAIGKELGARYVMEGSLRQAGSKLRLAVQLVDTVSGAHLWAENYERAFSPEAVFELQDDLVPRIVSTVADMNGALPRSMSEVLRSRPPEQLSPYEAVLRSFAYPSGGTPEELAAARSGLEEAVRKAPSYADAWAMLSFLCGQDYVHGFELQANALEIAASAARRAVALGPSNHLAYFSLASVLWYQKDYDSFCDAAERAVALNPMDGNSVAFMGELLTYTGNAERGMQLAERAKQLNPNHPGWYWYADFYQAFSQGDYRGALTFALKVKLHGNPLAPMMIAAACGQLGDVEGGTKAVADLVKFRPELPAMMRKQVAKVWNPEYGERFLEGLRKAGLEIPAAGAAAPSAAGSPATRLSTTSTVRTVSGEGRADEGFWVAVLPVKYSGANADLAALAEGLTEDVVTGLSRFTYLRVIGRSSTAKYSRESADIRAIGKELGARYVMEASLRQAGTKLRLAAQLVDATSGAHLWAESYERNFSPESVFELQDDLVPRIVSTVADMNGILARSMSEAVRSRDPEQLSPYEAVLRSFGYFERMTPDDLTATRSGLESAVQKAPAYADALAMLALMYVQDHAQGFNLQEDALTSGLAAARRAVEAGPSDSLAYLSLAQALFFLKEFESFKNAAERAVALNPMDGNSLASLGAMLCYAGDWDRGLALAGRAKQLNPNHPGWYWLIDAANGFRKREFRDALNFALKVNLPRNLGVQTMVAAAHGQLGEKEAAAKAVQDLLKARPNIPATVRKDYERWWNTKDAEPVMEGLRKAGLDIAPATETSAPDQPRSSTEHPSGATRANEGFWIAVLPFRGASGDADLEALADGLSEDITAGLSRFPYLQVIAHNSAMAYKGRPVDIRTVGRELGARYVLEGSIRKGGRAVRVSAQLMDALSGTQLWSEMYDREIGDRENRDGGTFQVQDDLTDHIVTCVADGHGVLVRSMAAPTRDRNVEELSASELVLRYYAFMQQVDPQEHAALRAGFERALEREPNHAVAWACLSNLYALEYGDGFNPLEKPIERAREAAWRAVKIDPACQMGWKLLSVVHFFSRDFAAFRETADRAMALNPRDGTTLAYVGILVAYSGDWERGVALVQRAMDLNRHHPGWYYNASFAYHYRKGEYEAALLAAKKINMPEYHWTHIAIAACCGMLGRHEEAGTAIESLRKYNPTFLDLENIREEIARWDPDKDEVERLMQGLQKAGLTYGTKSGSADSVATQIESKLRSDPAAARSGSVASTTASGATSADEGFWVAVLPFRYSGSNAEITALAEGLTEDVLTGLSRFPYLRVIARSSTSRYANEAVDIRLAGKELGARYVMEGSLRQAGTKLRLAVQLVDATTGAHLWAENYERTFSPEAVFELQDELVPRIVSTIADMNGVLPRSMSEAIRTRNPEQLSPYEAVLRSFGYFERVTPEDLAVARSGLETAVRKVPAYADAWAMLALLHVQDYAQGFNLQADSLTSGTNAARRAVAAAPSNPLAHFSLAQALFFQKEFQSFRNAAMRAVELNPMDGNSLALLGEFLTYSGDAERGLALAERAKQLNPNHPGWYWHVNFNHAYREGDYRGAVGFALKSNMTDNWGRHALLAAAYGQLGERDAAGKALRDLLRLRPDVAVTTLRDVEKWFDAEHGQRLIEGLRKAGLEIGSKSEGSVAAKASNSGAIRAEEGFWVAVLPFRYSGSNPELTALAEGLTEDVLTGLSRFSYLRVIARGSSSRYANEAVDIRVAGKELGARYVMEGSLRQAGNKLRLAVQLVDATTGAHLWAENYERTFTQEDIFALQDDLVPRIVSTVADQAGVLPRSMSEALRSKDEDQLTPHESVLRAFSYFERINAEEHATVRRILERAVEVAPNQADCWAMLSMLYRGEHAQGFNPLPDSLSRALGAAQRAVDMAPSNHLAYYAQATTLFFQKDKFAFRVAAEKALALNRMDGTSIAFLGMLIAYSGEWERGCALVESAMQLNPNHPGWYRVPMFARAYNKGAYREAIEAALRINMPGYFHAQAALAATAGQLGQREMAEKAVRDLLAIRPDFSNEARHEYEKWYSPELVEHLLEGLRKAGLEIPPERGVASN